MNLSDFNTLEELAAALKPLLRQGPSHSFGDGVGGASVSINGAAGNVRDLLFYSGGSLRWVLRCDSESESGGDVGSNLGLISRTDSGTFKENIFEVDRETGDIYSAPWVDYSGTSTVTGWASFTEKRIEYKRFGHLVFVNYRLNGTSNSATTSFTVPYSEGQLGNPIWWNRSTNAGGAPVNAYGQFVSANLVGLYPTIGGSYTGWTASGSKACYGQFFYQTL